MKTLLLVMLIMAAAWPAYGQYSARQLTRKVVPPAAPATPPRPIPPPQYAPAAPGVAAPALTKAQAEKAKNEKAKNEAKQLEFFRQRAESGSDHAQYELGMRYLAGKGTAPDQKIAREWLGKSAKQGNAQAAKKLAELGPEPKSGLPAPAESATAKAASGAKIAPDAKPPVK